MDEIEILKKQLTREKWARREAESILEIKSSELYAVNQKHQKIVGNLALQHAVSSVLANARSEEVAVQNILANMSDLLQMKIGELWEVDKNGNDLRLYASYCLEEEKLKKFIDDSRQFSFSLSMGLLGRVLQSQTIHHIKDVTQEVNFPRAHLASLAGLRSAVAFPLCIENHVIGVIALFTDQIKEFDPVLLSVITDIGNQIGIFLEREHARKCMLDVQRMAGIAEVTTGMLHNIGNTLNSVNISVAILEEKLLQSKLSRLLSLRDLIQAHEHDLSTFISDNEQGKQLPHFLIELGNYWQNEQEKLKQELASLSQDVRHINDILKNQQFLSGSFGMVEPTQINKLIDDAVRISSFIPHGGDIEIQRHYQQLPLLLLDRVKLFQIVVNLVRNAFQAVADNTAEKKMSVQTTTDDARVYIHVSDNGRGIEKNNLVKIFTYGYMTKQEGSGIGLHASALSAQEMGGSLTAKSDGLNKGATFSLVLPCHRISAQT